MSRWKVAIDTGGTFTDLLAVNDEGRTVVVKVPSTPSEPTRSFLNAVRTLHDQENVEYSDIELLLHGTTVGINSLLQSRHPEIGLLTTAGFGDIMELARQTIPGERGSIYSWVKPPRIVPRSRVREIRERMDAAGVPVSPVVADDVRVAARGFRDEGIANVAICFLNSYTNAAHEQEVKAIFLAEYPECEVTLSTDTLPEFREYERTTATILNAILKPVVSSYVRQLERSLKEMGVDAPLFLMKSSGGVISAASAALRPVETTLSGPAASILGMAWTGRSADRANLITLDIGGTSTDVGVIDDGRPARTQEMMIGDLPLRVPSLDCVSVGSGGGSLAWRAPGGFAKVGPRSAGSDPGPACYGRGNLDATLTDANVYLGRLGEGLAGGSIRLQKDLAVGAVERFGELVGLDTLEAAHGILELSSFNIADAIRQISVARGRDPRRYTLVAAGGAGPLMAGRVAELVGCREVLVPRSPGVGCAVGLLVSDIHEDAVATALQKEENADSGVLNDRFSGLESTIRARLQEDGFDGDAAGMVRTVDLRYQGQRTELTVEANGGTFDQNALADLVHGFHQTYNANFGYDYEGQQRTEIVNIRVTGIVPMEHLSAAARIAEGQAEPFATRSAYFGVAGWIDTPIYDRNQLGAGMVINGPAVVEQYDSTTVILPGHSATVDGTGCLVIRLPE